MIDHFKFKDRADITQTFSQTLSVKHFLSKYIDQICLRRCWLQWQHERGASKLIGWFKMRGNTPPQPSIREVRNKRQSLASLFVFMSYNYLGITSSSIRQHVGRWTWQVGCIDWTVFKSFLVYKCCMLVCSRAPLLFGLFVSSMNSAGSMFTCGKKFFLYSSFSVLSSSLPLFLTSTKCCCQSVLSSSHPLFLTSTKWPICSESLWGIWCPWPVVGYGSRQELKISFSLSRTLSLSSGANTL